VTCDCCNHEVVGASKRDVLRDGWKFHDAGGGRTLVVCGDCERMMQERRAMRKVLA
jgi:transcription elongation factor Elf1